MQAVTQIRVVETVSVDPTQLETLYADLGFRSAEDIVCRATEKLSLRLNQCARAHQGQDFAALCKTARSIVPVAQQIGMERLARVAQSVFDCGQSGDPVALAACTARLIRIGEGSLMAVWDLQDVTI